MTIQDFIPYIIQSAGMVIVAAFIIGKYKSEFNHHVKLLNQHERAIEHLITRIDSMNNEFSFMKGWMHARNKE